MHIDYTYIHIVGTSEHYGSSGVTNWYNRGEAIRATSSKIVITHDALKRKKKGHGSWLFPFVFLTN